MIISLVGPLDLLRSRIEERKRGFELSIYNDEYLHNLEYSLTQVSQIYRDEGVKVVEYDIGEYDFINNPKHIKMMLEDITDN